jgi:hypothetical protein
VSKAVSPARQVEDAKAKQAAVRSSIQRDCRLEFTGYIIAENGELDRRKRGLVSPSSPGFRWGFT